MSEPITYVTDWERRHVTWTLPENTAHIRVEVVTSGAGTAWADCFQLESGYTMNEYNLLENSDFANGSTCWSASNTTSADGVANYNDSTGDAYRLYGSADLNKLAYQKVFVNKKAGDIVFRISGNARGNAVPLKGDRHFAIGLHTKYSDGTNTYNWKEFNTDVTEWQFTTEAYPYSSENASKTIAYVYYRLIYYGQENRAWFDNVQLSIDQTGTT